MAIQAGLARGLAQDLQYDQRIQDLRYQKQEMDRAQALNAAKVKMFVDDTDYMNAVNSFDNPRIKQYSEQVIKDLGKYINENPDYMYDAQKMMEVKRMKRQLKDNPYLHQGMASDDNIKKFNADLAEVAKNPGFHNTNAYDKIAQQLENYKRFGNQDGEDAARQVGVKAFNYIKPRDFIDLAKTGQELGNKFKDVEIEYLKNGRDGAYRTVPKEKSLNADARQFYLENQEQFDVNYTNKGLNPIEEAKKFIQSGIETKFDIGERNRLADDMALIRYKNSLENVPPGKSPYQIAFLNPGSAVVDPKDVETTFGSKIPHYLTNNDGSVKIDNTGDIFNPTGHAQDEGYRTDGKYKKTGIKILDGYVYKSMDWAKANGVVNEPFGPDLWREDKVDGDWSKKAEIVDLPLNDKGESNKVVRIKVNAAVNANSPDYQGKFDSNIVTTKQRTDVKESYLKQQLFRDTRGNLFTKDENGNAIPYNQ